MILFDKWKLVNSDYFNVTLHEKSITEKDGVKKESWTHRGYHRDIKSAINEIIRIYMNESCDEAKTLTELLEYINRKEKDIKKIILEKV